MNEAGLESWILLTVLIGGGAGALGLAWDLRRRAADLERLADETGRVSEALTQSEAIPAALELAGSRLAGANRAALDLSGVHPLHLVFTAPKTGATTLVATLEQLEFCANLRTAHFLSPEGIEEQQRNVYQWQRPEQRAVALRSLREAYQLRELLSARRVGFSRRESSQHPHARPWIISSVRDPIAQLVSGYFFATRYDSRDDLEPTLRVVSDYVVQRLGQRSSPGRWWSEELEAVFGIDVCRLELAPCRSFATGENAYGRFLVVRLESFDGLPEALEHFYGLSPGQVHVATQNRAVDREDGEFYRAVVARLCLPKEVLDRAYGAAYMEHFYSPEEISAFRERWSGGGSAASESDA